MDDIGPLNTLNDAKMISRVIMLVVSILGCRAGACAMPRGLRAILYRGTAQAPAIRVDWSKVVAICAMSGLALVGCSKKAPQDESSVASASRPNIVIILADDFGMGDIQAHFPENKIPTPYLDRFSAESMRFTNAHSGSHAYAVWTIDRSLCLADATAGMGLGLLRAASDR